MDKIRVGVVGLGFGASVHIPSMESVPEAEIVICARSRERLDSVAEEHRIAEAFTDYDVMLRNGNLDAVVIATPDDLHHRMALAAVDAGLHVFCEKPLALNALDAQEMYDRAEAAGVCHMVAYWTHWHPQTRYLRQLVHDGFLGKPVEFHLRWLNPMSYSLDDYKWRFDRRRNVGAISDIGSHLIDYVRWCFGDAESVCASQRTITKKPPIDGAETPSSSDSDMLLLRMRNGAHGTLCASRAAIGAGPATHPFEILLHGEEGSLWIAPTSTEGIWGKNGDEQPHEIPLPPGLWDDFSKDEPMMKQLIGRLSKGDAFTGAFVQAILHDAPCEPDFLAGVQAQRVIDAAVESNARREWISVE